MKLKKDVMESLYNRLITLEKIEGEYINPIYEWEWQQGVALYSIYELYKKDNDSRYLEFIKGWFSRMEREGVPEKNINTTSPYLAMVFLYEEGHGEYRDNIEKHADWIIEHFPRTLEGGLQHLTREVINRDEIWADTMFMTILFLAKAGIVLERDDLIEEAIYQAMLHIKYLSDNESGLFYHGISLSDPKSSYGKTYWGRGNCWITMGIPELIGTLGEKLPRASRLFLENAYKKQVDSLIRYQANDGMWNTVIDDEKSYPETSCTAGFSYGILRGIELGILDRGYYFHGYMGTRYIVDNYLDEEGNLNNVSYGTPVGYSDEDYKIIPFCQAPYGQALTLLALTRIDHVDKFYVSFKKDWIES